MEKNNTLETINFLRSKMTLNGKPLRPLTEEDIIKEIELGEQRRKKEEERIAKEQERLLGLIDGQIHQISKHVPEYEFSESDFSYDAEYDVDMTYYEYISYYVKVYPHGDKSNPFIGKFTNRGTASTDVTEWITDNGVHEVSDDDCWEYTQAAFEKSFSQKK